MGQRLVIIGAGMATAYLLQELGNRDHRMQVTVIGDELKLQARIPELASPQVAVPDTA